ncbi:TPA: hypothetical protein ACF2DD_002001 [Clostridium perfringens]
MGNKEYNKDLIIDWNKFKSEVKGKLLEKAQNSYIEFCKMLDEVDFELVGDYIGSKDKVELVYKFGYSIKLNIKPNSFKTYTYKTIFNFKNSLKVNNDTFIKFVGLTNGGNLIAKIKTFDGGVIDIDVGSYNPFSEARQDFYKKLKELNGRTTGFYKGKDVKINIYIDDVNLNFISPNSFKMQTYKSIINFKNNLKKNRDEFIKFTGLTSSGNLIAQIKTYDGCNIKMDISVYNSFNKSRCDFYNKLKEVGGNIIGCYKDGNTKLNILIGEVNLNPISPIVFKSQTYKTIINFKKGLKKNKDKLIKFIGLTNGNSLIAKIKTFDNIILNIDIANYNSFNESRQNTYNYCKENGYKILSPYINNVNKFQLWT